MPRLIVPSIGGGIKLSRTLRTGVAEGVCSGVGDDVGLGDAVGDSCAFAPETDANARISAAIAAFIMLGMTLDIISPVHIREKVVAPLALAEKFFIDIVCRKLFVQSIEASEVIDCSFCRVFFGGSSFHKERPVARLSEQEFARELFQNAISEWV